MGQGIDTKIVNNRVDTANQSILINFLIWPYLIGRSGHRIRTLETDFEIFSFMQTLSANLRGLMEMTWH